MKKTAMKPKRTERAKSVAKPTVSDKANVKAAKVARAKATKITPVIDILSLLAVRAFGQGFLAGADPRRAHRRHCVEATTHEHWRRGFDAGRDAISSAELSYGLGLKKGPVRAVRSR